MDRWPAAVLAAFVVWLPMLPDDSSEAAAEAAALVPDPRARHFFDPPRRVGHAVAGALGGPGRVAWDLYLVYPRGVSWEEALPAPVQWFHQLGPRGWADPSRYLTGDLLARALHLAVEEALPDEI